MLTKKNIIEDQDISQMISLGTIGSVALQTTLQDDKQSYNHITVKYHGYDLDYADIPHISTGINPIGLSDNLGSISRITSSRFFSFLRTQARLIKTTHSHYWDMDNLEDNKITTVIGISDWIHSTPIMANHVKPFKVDETIYGEIIEIGEHKVTINCLIDIDKQIFEKRTFDKTPFIGLENLKIGSIIQISMYTRPGEKHIFYELAGQEISEYFKEPKDFFEDFEDDSFFTPTK